MLEQLAGHLAKRYTCYYDTFGRRRCRNNRWSSWGRWVLLGIVVVALVLFLLLALCLSRRRAKRGRKPFYGTGWATGGKQQQQPVQNYQYANYQQGPTNPEYGYNNQPQGQNQSYYAPQPQYGNQAPGYGETGVTQPKPSYGGDGQYQAPPGPPPNRY